MSTLLKAVHALPFDDLTVALVNAILRAVEKVKSRTHAHEIERAIARGDIQGALDAVKMEFGAAELEEMVPQALRTAFETAGTQARDSLQEQLGAELRVGFDILNPEALDWIRERGGELITSFGESSLQAIRSMITSAYRSGATPAELASTIRESGIGLTERQLKALENYRAGLKASTQKLSESEIASRVETYGERLLRQRARLIARTETLRAAAEGNRELWRQAKAKGLIGDDAEVEWNTTGQENVCPECDELDGETAPVGGTFPGGIEGPPLHPACSCVLIMHPFGVK